MVDPLPKPPPTRIAAAIALVLAMLSASCAGGGGSGGGYRDHFEAGRYPLAYSSAQAAAGSPGSQSEAALVAGLSAEAMRDDARARQWLEPIARGGGGLAPRARAGLALIELRTGSPLAAARELEAASVQLTGHDAREAARVAAEAYERAGRREDARRLRDRAVGAGQPAASASALGPYSLQLGAFSTRSRAEQRLAEVRAAVRTAGLGEPRIEIGSRDGRVLYLLQAGQFNSSEEAERARRSLGVSSIVASRM